MKAKTLIKFGLLGAGAYLVYQNRQALLAKLEDKTSRTQSSLTEIHQVFTTSKKKLDRIQDNLVIIKAQKDSLFAVFQDLNYKFQIFNAETQARLSEIQTVTGKYRN